MPVATNFYQRLLADHRETEAALAQLEALLTAGHDWEACITCFQQLYNDLARHFVCEEYGLFPVLSMYRPMILMEAEHDDLLARQAALQQEIADSAANHAASQGLMLAFYAFNERLRAHIYEEESGIFPMAEAAFEPEEKALVARKLAELDTELRQQGDPRAWLARPEPQYAVSQTGLSQVPKKPIAYEQLFEAEHVLVQHMALQAGKSLKPHWAGQHQCLVMISGEVLLTVREKTQPLTPGMQVTLASRTMFSLTAQTDSHLLAVKVWPRPYFLRQMPPKD